MKVEWPAFTVERWPNHSPDQLRLQQAPPRGNLGYSITSSARDPGDPRCMRWRLIDLSQWIYEEFRITVAKQTLSRELRAMGYRSSQHV